MKPKGLIGWLIAASHPIPAVVQFCNRGTYVQGRSVFEQRKNTLLECCMSKTFVVGYEIRENLIMLIMQPKLHGSPNLDMFYNVFPLHTLRHCGIT